MIGFRFRDAANELDREHAEIPIMPVLVHLLYEAQRQVTSKWSRYPTDTAIGLGRGCHDWSCSHSRHRRSHWCRIW